MMILANVSSHMNIIVNILSYMPMKIFGEFVPMIKDDYQWLLD